MKTFGQKLRTDLNLQPGLNASIVKVYGFPVPIYLVCYNSKVPTRLPIKKKVHRAVGVFLFSKTGHQKLLYSQPYPLDTYNSSVTRYIVLTVDLAGEWSAQPVVKNLESISFKEMTVYDFKNSAVTSPLTQKFRKQRNRVQGTENTQAKLIQVDVDRSEDTVTFKFLTEVTKGAYPVGTKFKATLPDGRGTLIPNPSETYEIWIQVLQFFELLGTNPKDPKEIDVDDLKEVLRAADVKIWSSAPSFWWQGFDYNLTQLDSAIVSCDIPPTIWHARHGDNFLDKHTSGMIKSIDFFIPQMARKLSIELKKVK